MTDSALGDGTEEPPGRASYLFEGRRVLVADLVAAGLLKAGAQLAFRRRRSGEVHIAHVTADGRIELRDGRRFKSPSTAAAAATGRGPYDGWTAWELEDGTLLDVPRQELLDSVAEPPLPGSPAGDSSAARHALLKDARKQADAGTPVTLTVRDLLGWWEASRRGYLVSEQIAAELANHGLSTMPDFAAVGIDDRVTLTGPSADPEDVEEEKEAPEQEATTEKETPRTIRAPGPSDDEDKGEPIQGQTVGNLPSALRGVVSVTSSASFEEVFTKMQLNGYSQLPVLNGTRNLQGAVTWESVALARHTDRSAPFSRAITKAHAVSYADHLIDVIPHLEQHGFLLVRDQTNQIAGIITIADVAAEYGATARPFLLIGDLDRQLRRIISECLDLEEVIKLCDPEGLRGLTSFGQLTYGDYLRVLSNQDQWDKLGWPLDRKSFTAHLDELRAVRNELMHFNDKDKVGDDAVPKLRHMIELLRTYGG
ncbi:CBS domain-containing protein [Streptomyces sp. SID14515]|uniref:restriction system modified-DNA reader domain-containing protein n=1 Tax=Streptomyces sp. SID14515 TaxID=2706074 RepID=UPI0013CB6148|nr:CBS domain-containing protein [Streptomyces sp. SID14515]NEB39919.1 CBS domain-containing protein [Streptomyces sp. SID14515]